ncbi:MAG: 4Fe-4S binding protein [Bacteroidales bacterium]|nr:4Fe-4S binding protein [Bacteroidales bacterium]
MAIPTSRTREAGTISINTEKCDGCGLCVLVCGDNELVINDGVAAKSGSPLFGCIACGHCMAVCPNDAITVTGRTLSAEDLFNLPGREEAADYQRLVSLFKRRRSIREFSDRPVEQDVIQKILDAASTSPMGIPPSDVNVLVFDSAGKSWEFVKDFSNLLVKMKWFVTDWFLALMRPFWGRTNDEMFRKFIKPLIDIYTESVGKGEDVVTYNAPLVMYFYGSPYTDPADPVIAATTAMYAGESLGLGTCMLGAIHPFIQKGKAARRFREKYGIKYKSREGLLVIFGYPALEYRKGVRRTFASVTYN